MKLPEARAVVAGIVLLRTDGAALLQLRDMKPGLSAAGLWVFPGGHCDACETVAVCARREFREETGYNCEQLQTLTAFDYQSPDTGKEFRLNFLWAIYDGVQPVHCFEGQKICFVRRDAVAGHGMPEYVLPVWDLAIQALERASVERECFMPARKPASEDGR